ncbi:MAG: phage tail tape measure protein [Synergistaceae bacterium]|jgi:TP901 family phage tail tape measure protein
MTDQGFNTYFNLIDNFTSKFDGIMKRITSVTRDKYVVDFGVSDTSVKKSSEAVKKVMGDFDGLQDAFSQPLHLTVIDQISRHIDSIGKQLDILRAKAIIPVGLSTGTAAIGLAAGVVGVAAVGMGVAATIPAAADLEASMIRVNKLIGIEGDAAKGVQKDLQDMMMATGLGLDQVAAAYETAGGAGIGGDLMAAGDMEGARKEISDFVRITLEASSAFNMTADATSSMLSGIANVYKPIGKETNEFLRSVGSGIDAVADATIASEEKILTAMSHASSAMAMFDQNDKTVKDTIALSAALISTNMSGDAAGEAIKDFFNYAKTDSESKISQSLGMSSKEYQATLKSAPMAIVEAVTAKYNAMSAEEQGAYSKLFGMTGGKIPQLSGSANFQAGLLKAQDVVNPSYDKGDKMSESFGKSLAGTRTQLEKIYQTVTVFAQVIGSVFLPGLNAVLRVVNALLTPLAMFIRYVAELAAKIPGMNLIATAASILAVVTAVSVLASFLGPIIAGLGLASKAMMILAMYGNIAGLVISTMAGTIGAIVGILGGPLTIILVLAAAVGYLLYKTGYLQKAWDKFKDSAIGKDLIGGVIAGVALVTDAFSKLFSWLDEQWSKGSEEWAKGSEGAFGWLLSALDTIASTFGWLFDKLDDAYESGALGNALKISLMGLLPIVALVKSLMTIADYARKLLDGSNVVSDLLSAGSKAWDDISNGVQWLYDTVLGMVSWLQESVSSIPDIPEWIKKLPGDTSDAIKDWLQDSVESIPDGIVEWLKKLWDILTSLPSSISSAITGIFPWGGEGAEEKAPTFEGYKEYVENAKKGSENYRMYTKTSDEVLRAAYTEGQTGIPQEHPYIDEYEYNLLVSGYKKYSESGTSTTASTASPFSNISTGNLSPHETEVKRSEGNIDYEASRQKGIAAGLILDDSQYNVKSYTNGKETISPKAWDTLGSDQKEHWTPQYAVGATFKKDGLFAGRVHAPEEIIPQATAQRGAGPIARALDTLYGVTAGKGASSSPSPEVHVHNVNDFSCMRVSSDVDIEKLMKEIDRRIESRSISAVHKAMGQRRT